MTACGCEGRRCVAQKHLYHARDAAKLPGHLLLHLHDEVLRLQLRCVVLRHAAQESTGRRFKSREMRQCGSGIRGLSCWRCTRDVSHLRREVLRHAAQHGPRRISRGREMGQGRCQSRQSDVVIVHRSILRVQRTNLWYVAGHQGAAVCLLDLTECGEAAAFWCAALQHAMWRATESASEPGKCQHSKLQS